MPQDTIDRMAARMANLQWIVVAALAFVMLTALLMMLLTMWNTYRLGEQSTSLRSVAVETHDALCALYNKEVTVNEEAEALLKDSPAGLLDDTGRVVIAANLIQRGIDSRRETISALKLAGLDCSGEVIT